MFRKLKKLKSFTVLIIPDSGTPGATARKLTPGKVISVIILYSLIIFILSALLFVHTPIRDFFITESNLSSADLEMIEELNERMLFLAKELESLKSTNERLRYAIMLGDSTLADSLTKKKEGEKENNETLNRSGGNLLAVLKDFFFNVGKEKQEVLYYFRNPVNGFISREFNAEKGHFGVDYVLKTGSPVYASASGYIIFADYTVKDGYMVIISHSNDYISVYKHCSVLAKREREIVMQGDLIALSGNTGSETLGPHLHFEIWKNGIPINPKKILLSY